MSQFQRATNAKSPTLAVEAPQSEGWTLSASRSFLIPVRLVGWASGVQSNGYNIIRYQEANDALKPCRR